jgi:hypothetical protein
MQIICNIVMLMKILCCCVFYIIATSQNWWISIWYDCATTSLIGYEASLVAKCSNWCTYTKVARTSLFYFIWLWIIFSTYLETFRKYTKVARTSLLYWSLPSGSRDDCKQMGIFLSLCTRIKKFIPKS